MEGWSLMTPEEFKNKMQEIYDKSNGGGEVAHMMADVLLCEVLMQLGYKEGIDIFNSMEVWYA